jgi:MtN3 and saliva related transmembrane protein
MSFLSILATIFGLLMSFASIPQAHKIFKRKSAKDISFITYLLFTLGSIVWLLYGIEIGDIPIIWSYAAGTVCSASVLVGWIKYH